MSKEKVLLRVFKYFILIIFPLILLTYDGLYKNPYPHETVFGDEKLKVIHSEFIQDCKRFGCGGVVRDKDLLIMDYDQLYSGFVGLTSHKLKAILIDTTIMGSSKSFLYVVAYHELAHFYLRAKHDSSCDLCIMMPSISIVEAMKIYYNMEQYKKKLFK